MDSSFFQRLKIFLSIRQQQWQSKEDLEKIQMKKLLETLNSARKTKFYGGALAKFKNNDLLDDLSHFPITSKTDLSAAPEDFLRSSLDKSKLIVETTSGSTGIPKKLFFDSYTTNYRAALLAMIQLEFGRSPFDLYAEVSLKTPPPFPLSSLGLYRKLYLPLLDDEEKTFSTLNEKKPDILAWYPSMLTMMAKINDDNGNPLKLKKAFSGGELLTGPSRKLIEDSFSCQVFNQYAATEVGAIAFECPEEHSFHINSNSALVEIVDDQGNPKEQGVGRIIITSLINQSMPLIRYDIGDLGSWGGECSCGRGLPTLESISGRADDLVVLPSGKVRSARHIIPLDFLDSVKQYQIIQESEDRFTFRYVPAKSSLSQKAQEYFENQIRTGCLGEDIHVDFESVDSIKRGKSGKLRKVISKLTKK
ncbi:hypothetical protein KKE92_05720 [Candidatus Micrarchaeota archaeon]|nr:hypothetical protein [Candidatus Micrarchaeota archaeon]MBU1681230.1 hypothetical protein [Candidatus Micrarchaeota archaeon]